MTVAAATKVVPHISLLRRGLMQTSGKMLFAMISPVRAVLDYPQKFLHGGGSPRKELSVRRQLL